MYLFGGNARYLTNGLVEYDLSPEANGHPVSSIFRLNLGGSLLILKCQAISCIDYLFAGTYGKGTVIERDYDDDPDYPTPRYFHSAVVYEDSMYIWGGTKRYTSSLREDV